MSPLELRKRLLLAESDLNRAQMLRDLGDFKYGFNQLAEQAKTLGGHAKKFGGLASSILAILAGLSAFRRGRSTPAPARRSWWQFLFKNAGLLSSLWLALRQPKGRASARGVASVLQGK